MRGYVKCLWYCQRGTRGFWRGVCDFNSGTRRYRNCGRLDPPGWCSRLWEDLKDGLVVGEATGGTDRGITHQRRYPIHC